LARPFFFPKPTPFFFLLFFKPPCCDSVQRNLFFSLTTVGSFFAPTVPLTLARLLAASLSPFPSRKVRESSFLTTADKSSFGRFSYDNTPPRSCCIMSLCQIPRFFPPKDFSYSFLPNPPSPPGSSTFPPTPSPPGAFFFSLPTLGGKGLHSSLYEREL